MSELTLHEALAGVEQVDSELRSTIALLEDLSIRLDGHFHLENVLMSLKQLTSPRDYNVHEPAVLPVSSILDAFRMNAPDVSLRHGCGCGARYDSAEEVELCSATHPIERQAPVDIGVEWGTNPPIVTIHERPLLEGDVIDVDFKVIED